MKYRTNEEMMSSALQSSNGGANIVKIISIIFVI